MDLDASPRDLMSPNTIDLLADKLDALVTLVRRAQIDGNALQLGSALQQLERTSETVASATRTVVQLQRQAGATWADIGRLLDMTRQAAQQRFSS